MSIEIKRSHETCDSCKDIKDVNVIYSGEITITQMVLCDDCTEILYEMIKPNACEDRGKLSPMKYVGTYTARLEYKGKLPQKERIE